MVRALRRGQNIFIVKKVLNIRYFSLSTPMKYSIYIVDSSELVMVVDPKAGPVWSYNEHAIKFE